MRESMWGIFVVGVGIGLIALIYFFQNVTNTDEHNYYLLKETTEAAMMDAIDYVDYRVNNVISINREKFVESFVRRFAENADLSNSYVIEIYDVNETPPKVSLRVKTKEGAVLNNEEVTFSLINQIDAIIEELEPKTT